MSVTVKTSSREFIINDVESITTSGVYLANDELFKRKVAIKVIVFDASLTDRELNEALEDARSEVAVLVNAEKLCVNVPCLIDEYYDAENKKLYIVMQWINGDTLRKIIENPLKEDKKFIQWMIELAQALSLMEKKRIYHNDIKPENIMIDKANQLNLIDFNVSATKNTMYVGTPYYIAPELTEHIDHTRKDKADMFSMGVMMYEYFTGVIPSYGEHYRKKGGICFGKKAEQEWGLIIAPKEINNDIPQQLSDLIVRLMSRIPSNRFDSYADLKIALIKAKRSLADK